MAPVLDFFSFQHKEDVDGGLPLNTDAISGNFVDIETVSGLDSSEFKQETHSKAGAHGSYVSAQHLEPRTIILDGTAYSDTPGNLGLYLDSLKANYRPGHDPEFFYWRYPSAGYRRVLGHSLGIKYDWDSSIGLSFTDVQFQILCGDPRIYAGTFTTVTSSPKPAGQVSVTVTNTGTMSTGGIIRVEGNITNARVTNTTTGKYIQVDRDMSEGGAFLQHDLRQRLSTRNAGANVRHLWGAGSSWFEFVPGNNIIQLTGTGTGALLKVTPWSAWW